jgi:hypothetical protein
VSSSKTAAVPDDTTAQINTFHWHVVDSQSFPLVIPGFADIAEKGAYSASAVYTPEDVADIVSYAGAVRSLPVSRRFCKRVYVVAIDTMLQRGIDVLVVRSSTMWVLGTACQIDNPAGDRYARAYLGHLQGLPGIYCMRRGNAVAHVRE